jgi:menaquinone-dependent protoporphyrinogen oxidase
MANILAVYGTSYGHTAKVVERIAHDLVEQGHRVTIWRGDRLPARYALDVFDAFLVAGSVLMGRHQRYLRDFVKANARRLNASPSLFVSVCGALAGSWSRGQGEARGYVSDFLDQTGWRPSLALSVAGALPYTKYGLLTRWMMKLVSKSTGRPTDTSRDWEFTDWGEVDRVANEFSDTLGATQVTVAT